MKECTFYEPKERNVQCTACRHQCVIAEQGYGICGARKNISGKLFLLTYAKPCSIHLDPMEKKPLFHYKPGTNIMSIGFFGCNFRCSFCQNYEISTLRKKEAEKALSKMREVTPEQFIALTEQNGAKSIAFTYNEPEISIEYCLDAMELAKKKNIGTVFVSNGYESKEAIKALKGKLDAINIDLKSFNEKFYKELCGAKLEHVLDSIKAFHKNGTWVELTTLLIPGKNNSKRELEQIAGFIASIDKGIPWHLSAFHPTHKMLNVPRTTKEQIIEAIRIGKEAGLKYVYGGNLFDEGLESTYCPKCSEQLIKRTFLSTSLPNFKKGKCNNCGEKIEGVFE